MEEGTLIAIPLVVVIQVGTVVVRIGSREK